MAKLPGSAAMLKGLTRFDAHKRWSVKRALSSGLFAPYRSVGGSAGSSASFSEYLDDPPDC